MPASIARVPGLSFTYVSFGERLTYTPNGWTDKPGNWTALKLFFESDESEEPAEVYLNYNLKLGKAEFSIKDADYAEAQMKHFASVL